MVLPENPAMLVSFLNMKLRDEDETFEGLASLYGFDPNEVTEKLKKAGFHYNEQRNQFI